MELENIKIAWLAGLVDGEGSIGAYISRTVQRVRNGRIHKSFHVVYQFTVSNTNELIIQEAHDIVSLILGKQTPITAIQVVADKRPERKNSRLGYCVNVKDHQSIIKLLSVLEPYLIGKKSQAKVMLQLLKTHRRNTQYTKAELEIIEILKKMKKHNTKPHDGNAELSQESIDSSSVSIWNETD